MTADFRTTSVPDPTWLRFREIRVAKVDALENCLADRPAADGLPLLAVQTTFALSQLIEGGATFRRNQYVSAWQVGTCDAEAVSRLSVRGLLLPVAMEWDGCPAVAFELCERLSPVRDATQLKGMRVRPLRTYLVLVAGEAFAPRAAGRCWQKVSVADRAIRPVPPRVGVGGRMC